MNLYIEKIIIEKNGQITENYSFKNKVSVVNGSIELYDIIRLLLGVYDTSNNFYDIRFFAVVKLEKTYYIHGNKSKGNAPFNVSVLNEDGADCTKEYFEELKQSEEVESALFFHKFKKQDYPHKLFKYKDLFKYYPDGSFSHLTNGYGTTRSFRGFIANYIKHFKPIKLREDKDLFLNISDSGEFKVAHSSSEEDVALSQSENMLYHYLSFISIADFWDRAEKIRNLNRINKPLIVSGIIRFLDDDVNIRQLVGKTKNIARQVIVFTNK